MSSLRTAIQATIIHLERRDSFNGVDAARELRRALDEAAGGQA
jgi:hypothetical protein